MSECCRLRKLELNLGVRMRVLYVSASKLATRSANESRFQFRYPDIVFQYADLRSTRKLLPEEFL